MALQLPAEPPEYPVDKDRNAPFRSSTFSRDASTPEELQSPKAYRFRAALAIPLYVVFPRKSLPGRKQPADSHWHDGLYGLEITVLSASRTYATANRDRLRVSGSVLGVCPAGNPTSKGSRPFLSEYLQGMDREEAAGTSAATRGPRAAQEIWQRGSRGAG